MVKFRVQEHVIACFHSNMPKCTWRKFDDVCLFFPLGKQSGNHWQIQQVLLTSKSYRRTYLHKAPTMVGLLYMACMLFYDFELHY